MEIITLSDRDLFIKRIELVKYNLADWLIVEVQIKETARHMVTSAAIAEVVGDTCGAYDGFAMICNASHVLLLIDWGRHNRPQRLVAMIQAKLPPDTCETTVSPATSEGIKRILQAASPPDEKDNLYYSKRLGRKEAIFLVADDDSFMLALVKAGLQGEGSVVEIGKGPEVEDAYKRYNPDMVLLDIHLPGMSGHEVLSRLMAIDPTAYIIMLSGDSSPENVKWTARNGAKGFLVKPFSKPKLTDYILHCPTIQRPAAVTAR